MKTSTNMDKPKNRIKEVLEERGIKQTWLAERLGKSFCIVNSYVCNRRQPSLDVLFEIANILEVDVSELFFKENTDDVHGFLEYKGNVYRINGVEDIKEIIKLININFGYE